MNSERIKLFSNTQVDILTEKVNAFLDELEGVVYEITQTTVWNDQSNSVVTTILIRYSADQSDVTLKEISAEEPFTETNGGLAVN